MEKLDKDMTQLGQEVTHSLHIAPLVGNNATCRLPRGEHIQNSLSSILGKVETRKLYYHQ